MSMKIRRGIALLVAAVVALLIGLAVDSSAVQQITGLLVLLCGAAGVVLLIWGLLSPDRRLDG